jgi:F-type H+-transporting ATPase subunit b
LEDLFKGLGITWSSLIAQLVNFGVLFVLLWVVGYKPLMRTFDERARKIKDSMEQAEQVKSQAAKAEEDLKKQIEVGRKEGQEIVTRAIRSGEELRQKAQLEARKDGEAIIATARTEIQRERDEAIIEIRHEFADLAITAAEKVIDRSLDKQAHRDIIDKVLEQSKPNQG